MKHRSFKFLQIIVLAILPCLTGCSTSWLNTSLGMGTKLEQESVDNPVIKLIPVWQEGEGPGVENQVSSRGFGGQIYFITEKKGLPSEVKGSIMVYLFDDKGTPEEQAKPIYQFNFEPEAWMQHSIMTKLGPAYTLFIPYPRPGRDLANCALRIRSTPPHGSPLFSQMTTLTLPGATKAKAKEEAGEIEMTIPKSAIKKTPTTINLSGDSPRKKKIVQVAAEDDAEDDATKLPGRVIEHAVYDDEPDDTEPRDSRIRRANHEDESDEQPVKAKKTRTNPFLEGVPKESSVRTFSIQVD
jgi:hypothetical protein